MDINEVELLGRAGQDAEIKYTQQGLAILNCSIATNESWKDKQGQWQSKTTWHKVFLMGKQAEKLAPLIRKGVRVLVKGAYVSNSYKDKTGQEKTIYQVKARILEPFHTLAHETPSVSSTPDFQEGFDDDQPPF